MTTNGIATKNPMGASPLSSERVFLDLPEFDENEEESPLQEREVRILRTPDLSSYIPPSQESNRQVSIELPTFTVPSNLSSLQDDSLLSLNLPAFGIFEHPKRDCSVEPHLSLPNLSSNSYDMPRIYPTTIPTLAIPSFTSHSFPHAQTVKVASITLPTFAQFQPPDIINPHKRPVKAPSMQAGANPIMSQFDRLAKFKSYEDILRAAAQLDSLGDVRMLRHRSILEYKYLHSLLDHLMREIPSHFPKSAKFKIVFENDQEQIDLLAQYCRDLVKIESLEDPKLSSPSALIHLLTLDCALQKRALLEIKDFIYCFCTEILCQEKKVVEKFNAVPKDLTSLSEALTGLAIHIQESIDTRRMETVRKAVKLDFAPWEDRDPVEIKVLELEAEDVPENFDIDKGLEAIQKPKPETYELADYTNAVIQLPEATPGQAKEKAKYLLELARVYYNLPKPTTTALVQAISWTDQAIDTIQRHFDKDDLFYLECYECRGAIWYKKGELEKPRSTHENALVRKSIDIASRDFTLSVPLETPQDTNFVRLALESKQEKSLDTAIRKAEASIQRDEDFAEARFVAFLKHFEKSQFDSPRLLHAYFNPLKASSSLLAAFKELLFKKAYSTKQLEANRDLAKNATQFKIVLSSATYVVQITPEGVALDTLERDALSEILTQNIKNVEVLYTPSHKTYFAPLISQEQFSGLVEKLGDHQKRLEEMETALQKFRQFELSALYKSTFVINQEKLLPNAILSRVDPQLLLLVIDMEIMLAQGYSELGKTTDHKERLGKALLYLLRAISHLNFLLADSPDSSELKAKKLQLLFKLADLYKQLNLWNSCASTLEEVMKYGKQINPRFSNPSLHYALGIAYDRLGRFKEAKNQLQIVSSFKKRPALVKKAHQLRKQLKKKKPEPKDDTSDAKIVSDFQEKNILEECIQILEANAYVNAPGEPNRKVALWDEFAKRIKNTTTLQQLCEVVLTFVLPSEAVKADNLLRIVRLSNIAIADPTDLDQIKGFLLDALCAYKEKEALLQDKVIEAHAISKRKLAQAEAFYAFKKTLSERLKDGELIRPGSASRKKIEELLSQLPWHENDSLFVLESLKTILGNDFIPDGLALITEDITEIKEHLESVLDLNLPPAKVDNDNHILEFTGKNIFLSEILAKINSSLSRTKIQDIHIVGLNVYVDTSLTFQGINLAIGGEYIQFMPDKSGTLLTIDLSGKDGEHAQDVTTAKAANATQTGQSGTSGEDGNFGDGGQCGGDLCVTGESMIGLDPAIIYQINLNGGAAGNGSNGGAGGDGFQGTSGKNARTTVQDGDPADSSWGHLDFRHGERAIPGSDGGKGGDAGLAGVPGEHGNIYIEKGADKIQLLIQKEEGSTGTNGNCGAGGKGGEGVVDGFDHVKVKGGGWFFVKSKSKSGYGLHCTDARHDRDIDNWAESVTTQEMINRNQGRSRGRGKSAEEQTRSQNKQDKNNLKRQVFDSHRSKFLHTEGSKGKGYAFDSVTNRLAVARDTEAALAEQLAVKQRKMKDIDTLMQTTAAILSQTQSEQTTTTQHTRLATFTKKEKKINQAKEILSFRKYPGHDSTNVIPFHDFSPVAHHNKGEVHVLEYAIHAVNMTKGRHMPSLGKLVQELVSYGKDSACDKEKYNALIQKIAVLIENATRKHTSEGFHKLIKMVANLKGINVIQQAINHKKRPIKKFLRRVATQKKKVEKAYKVRFSELTILNAITNFLKRDRLFLRVLSKDTLDSERTKYEKWFNQRLYQKIVDIVKNKTKREPKPHEIERFLKFAEKQKAITQEIDDKLSYPKFLRKALGTRQDIIRREITLLGQGQNWIMRHLPELVEADILPSYESVAIQDLYKICSSKWANISSSGPDEAKNEEKMPEEEELPPSKWSPLLEQSSQQNWPPSKQAKWEGHIKQLADANLENVYFEELEKLYLLPGEFDEVADIFVLHVIRNKDLMQWEALKNKLIANDISTIYHQRNLFISNDKDEDQELYTVAHHYLQNRHLLLIRKECEQLLPQEFHPFLLDFLPKANDLFAFREILPNADFLVYAKAVVQENIALICSKDENTSFSDTPLELLLKKVVHPVLGNVNLKEKDHLVLQCQTAVQAQDFAKAGAYFFLSMNLGIDFDKNLELLKALEPTSQNDEPILKNILLLLSHELNLQKEQFDAQWGASLQRARLLDQLRKQLDKEDTESIERYLSQIGNLANLLSSGEKISILNNIISVLAKEGCFSTLFYLQIVHRDICKKLGVIRSEADTTIKNYNNVLSDALASSDGDKDSLPSLFMQIIQNFKCSDEFLTPAWIAINQLTWDPQNLIKIYLWIESWNTISEPQSDLKTSCLNKIRQLLVEHLQKRYQGHLEQQKNVGNQLARKQAEIVEKVGSVIRNTKVFSPDHQIAKFQLWLKMLDLHYCLDNFTDGDGKQREKHYEKAYQNFLEKMKAQDTQEGMDAFNVWLGRVYNKLKRVSADLTFLDQLATANGTTAQEPFKNLNQLYWRGVITYKAALDRIKGTLSDESATRLKLKLDDSMIHEEYSEIKKRMDDEQIRYQERVTAWIEYISSSLDSGEAIEKLFPNEATLKSAIESRKIPEFFPKEKKVLAKDLSLQEWLDDFLPKKVLSVEENNYFAKGWSKVDPYLKDLEERIAKEEIEEDDPLIIKSLKTLLERWQDIKASEYKEKIDKIEKDLINLSDLKEQRKKDHIEKFLELVKADFKNINSYQQKQNQRNLERLESSLSSCAVLLGDEMFSVVLQQFIDQWNNYHDNLTLPALANLFWVIPRLNQLESFFDVTEYKLPENWSLTLLEMHCYEVLSPILDKMMIQLPPINLSKLKDSQKDEEIDKILKQNKKRSEDCFTALKGCLESIKKSPLRASEKELLYRIIAERLSLLNQGKLEFSIEEFTSLLTKYLADPLVLLKISEELAKKHSIIANTLLLPSFQAFKYSLTMAWMEAALGEPIQRMNKEDRQKIYDSLLQIETSKKEEMMYSVVNALKGDIMTPAVAECIAHFADGTWELDETSLEHLHERTASGKWYKKIEKYSKKIRSKPRTLKNLVEIMAKESNGINSAVKDLITGPEPELVHIVKKIKTKFKEGIKDWSQQQITDWAKANKSETFLDDPERLMEGIAVMSHAYQLFHKDHHTLRKTQMIALWLELRPTNGVQRGRISQMFTGEGKSITFASLAVLRAMTRSHVDVITTSFVLAKRDAEEFADLFNMFDMTVSNNCDEECEKDEEVRKTRYYRDKKPVDIVYGDVAAFERDLLLTEFHGKQIIHEERMGPNRSVLIDEVDGLFLDNAGMVLYLSHNVDTLRFLEHIFGQIWAMANHPAFEQVKASDEKAVEEICKLIKEKIENGEITLPSYQITNARYSEMKEIIHRKLPIWVRSSLHAKALRVNDEYIIADQVFGQKKKKTITVMDKATGVEQYSLKWSNGLNQFLQFKHGLELTPESLKAVFLSNYFCFDRYGQHIYGLSGTLGSDTEQQYLKELYQVDLAKIPRFKGEKYIKYKDTVVGDADEWIKKIQESVDRELNVKKRAALIICDSIEEVMVLQEQFKKQYPLVHIYTSTTQTEEISFFAHENPTQVEPGDLIIATNLAGRGTDLKTSKALEDHGGLHVILSNLPLNIRIQEQGFGRTARSGNEGSGELIVLDPYRRSITELCRQRDLEEKQRLESVALREIKKIKFENELLRGFAHNNEKIEGFQHLLKWVEKELEHEEKFYLEAQINSLKNRWAFWIDHMEEKITMVHAIGKETVIASFKEFQRGVREDFAKGGFRLIKEPVELIKLGGEYRRKENWTKAEECYAEAALDPHYRYALYYRAACRLLKAPSSDNQAKKDFRNDAKKAILAIKPEIKQLQSTLQSVNPIAEQTRVKQGAADYGNPYKARTDERIQIWSIFLTAIDEALGGTLTEETLKKSQYTGDKASEILQRLGTRYRAHAELSKKLTFHDDKVVYENPHLEVPKKITVPKMLQPVLARLKGKKKITNEVLKTECQTSLLTREQALSQLECPKKEIYKFATISSSFKWPDGYAENVQFVISSIIDELKLDSYASIDEMKQKLKDKKAGNKLLERENIDLAVFFDKLNNDKQITKDQKIELKGAYVIDPPVSFASTKELQLSDLKKGFTSKFHQLPPALQEALFTACRLREVKDDQFVWSLKQEINLSDLSLPTNADEASETLWNIFEEHDVTKVTKVRLDKAKGHFQDQLDGLKDIVKTLFDGQKDADKAVDSIYGLIDSTIGMIYRLEDKKTTAKFADIIQKHYYDHQQHAPEGLGEFIQLGLEVIADLIEKKDPPAWFEVVAVIAIGLTQMVAGVIIKAYLPFVGDLIGNALISTGMDDIMFAVESAISGEFSWADYGTHKVASLKSSIISSAIGCGISFGVDAVKMGSVTKAWDVQKLSGVERMAKAGQIAAGTTFNLGSHVVKEVGRNLIQMGISQVASRGLQGMTRLIASSYEKDIQRGIEKAVNEHWAATVVPQAQALFDKIDNDQTAPAKIKGCIETLIKSSMQDSTFDSVIRGCKQVFPHAKSLLKNSGWGTFLSAAPELVDLGVSIAKLTSLVKGNVHQLARDIRATNDRTPADKATNQMSQAAFNAQLEQMKTDYAAKLHELFTKVLNGAVFAPLVSMGTKALVEAGSGIIPMTEQEAVAQSSETLSEILEAENNVDEAFYDKAKRHWREANDEVVNLTDAQMEQTPVNASESIEKLKAQYGSLLKVYKDKDGNLYVQRPTRSDYIKGILEGKASGDPEIAALAKAANKKIAIVNSDGKIKTFSVDAEGKVTTKETVDDNTRNKNDTIYLKYEANSTTGVGHVTVEGAIANNHPSFFEGQDCLYEAVIQSADLQGKTPDSLRQDTSKILNEQEFKQYYHDWSLSDEPKQFAGATPYFERQRVSVSGIGQRFKEDLMLTKILSIL